MSALDVQEGGSHYKHFEIQPAEYCEVNRLTGLESTVVKYVSRHRFKNGVEDIRKAIHCLELILEIQYGINNNTLRHRDDGTVEAQGIPSWESTEHHRDILSEDKGIHKGRGKSLRGDGGI